MNNHKSVRKEIFANTSFEETRIAILEDGKLAELFWERRSNTNIVGNIYKAVPVDIDISRIAQDLWSSERAKKLAFLRNDMNLLVPDVANKEVPF